MPHERSELIDTGIIHGRHDSDYSLSKFKPPFRPLQIQLDQRQHNGTRRRGQRPHEHLIKYHRLTSVLDGPPSLPKPLYAGYAMSLGLAYPVLLTFSPSSFSRSSASLSCWMSEQHPQQHVVKRSVTKSPCKLYFLRMSARWKSIGIQCRATQADPANIRHYRPSISTPSLSQTRNTGTHRSVDTVISLHVAVLPGPVMRLSKGNAWHTAGDGTCVDRRETSEEGRIPWLGIGS